MEHLLIGLSALLFLTSCTSDSPKPEPELFDSTRNRATAAITFVELGSVGCIPCKKMQPIMKSIEERYGSQVSVVFHDVWTPEGRPYADQYGIQAIPTQVFLDEQGKEFFRHLGYLPEEHIDKILQERGLKPKTPSAEDSQ